MGWFTSFFENIGNAVSSVVDPIASNVVDPVGSYLAEQGPLIAVAIVTDGIGAAGVAGADAAAGFVDYGAALDSAASALSQAPLDLAGYIDSTSIPPSGPAVDYGGYFDSTAGPAQYPVDYGGYLDSTAGVKSGFGSFTLRNAADLLKTGADAIKLVNGQTVAQASATPKPYTLSQTYYAPQVDAPRWGNPLSSAGFGRSPSAQQSIPGAAAPAWYETTAGQVLAGVAVAAGLVVGAKHLRV